MNNFSKFSVIVLIEIGSFDVVIPHQSQIQPGKRLDIVSLIYLEIYLVLNFNN